MRNSSSRLKIGSPVRRVGAAHNTLGVVYRVRDGEVRLLCANGSLTGWVDAAALVRPSAEEVTGESWVNTLLGEDTRWIKLGSPLRIGAVSLGVVWLLEQDYDDLPTARLLLEDGSITADHINLSALSRPTEAELAAAPWISACWASWVRPRAPVRREDGSLGVVFRISGPKNDGDDEAIIQLVLEDGSTTDLIYLAGQLTGTGGKVTKPKDEELASAPWLTKVLGQDTDWVQLGSALRIGAHTLGVVCDADFLASSGWKGESVVKLLYGDGSVSQTYIDTGALARPSDNELMGAPWLTEPKLQADISWVTVGSELRAGPCKVGKVTSGPDSDGKVRLTWADGSVSYEVAAAVLTRPLASDLLQAIREEQWSTITALANEAACVEQDCRGDHVLHHMLRAAPTSVSEQLIESGKAGHVPRANRADDGSVSQLVRWLDMSEEAAEEIPTSNLNFLTCLVPEYLSHIIQSMGLTPEAESEFRAAVDGLTRRISLDGCEVAKYSASEDPRLRDDLGWCKAGAGCELDGKLGWIKEDPDMDLVKLRFTDGTETDYPLVHIDRLKRCTPTTEAQEMHQKELASIEVGPSKTQLQNTEREYMEALAIVADMYPPAVDLPAKDGTSPQTSKNPTVRQWGKVYGTFQPNKDRSVWYRVVGSKIHISGTCLVIFAWDLQKNIPVALKLMRNKEEWLREQDMRKLPGGKQLDENHCVALLDAVELEEDPAISDHRLKGEGINLYLLVMAQAKRDLSDALSHYRFAGRIREQVVDILYQVAEHLKYLNEECGRCHGDIKPRNLIQLEVETDSGTELAWVMIDLDASCAIGSEAGQKVTSSAYFPPEMARQQLAKAAKPTRRADLRGLMAQKEGELDLLESTPRKLRDITKTKTIMADIEQIRAELKHSAAPEPLRASIVLEMWYFGVLLYQLCTLDGQTLWDANQADNIDDDQLRQLAYQWPDVKASKLDKIVWPQAANLAELLLQEDADNRPKTWVKVMKHPFFASRAGPPQRVRVIMSCPEWGTLDKDGGVQRVKAGVAAKDVYNHHVMDKVSELQKIGYVKLGFDRAGTSTARAKDAALFDQAFALRDEGRHDEAVALLKSTDWWYGYQTSVKQAVKLECQGFDGVLDVTCIKGGFITQLEAAEMGRIMCEAQADCLKSGISVKHTITELSYCEFLAEYEPVCAPKHTAQALQFSKTSVPTSVDAHGVAADDAAQHSGVDPRDDLHAQLLREKSTVAAQAAALAKAAEELATKDAELAALRALLPSEGVPSAERVLLPA